MRRSESAQSEQQNGGLELQNKVQIQENETI
jgi:hypothetical protein